MGCDACNGQNQDRGTKPGDEGAGKQDDERKGQCARAGGRKKPGQYLKKRCRWGRRIVERIVRFTAFTSPISHGE